MLSSYLTYEILYSKNLAIVLGGSHAMVTWGRTPL